MSFSQGSLKKWPQTMNKHFKQAQDSEEFSIVPNNVDKLDKFYIMLKPTGGYYKDHTYILEMITNNSKDVLFPYTPPKLKFINKIWHSNIYTNGDICVDILKGEWSPQSITSLMSCIILLLDKPENSSPANAEAAKLFKQCESNYNEIKSKDINHIEAREKCFIPFKKKATEFAGDFEKYIKYFDKE